MPFGEYKDFQDCINKTMSRKKWGKERASAYCAVIERKIKKEMSDIENPQPEMVV